jgi:hypothetical protein
MIASTLLPSGRDDIAVGGRAVGGRNMDCAVCGLCIVLDRETKDILGGYEVTVCAAARDGGNFLCRVEVGGKAETRSRGTSRRVVGLGGGAAGAAHTARRESG